jgi:hypothetical protein
LFDVAFVGEMFHQVAGEDEVDGVVIKEWEFADGVFVELDAGGEVRFGIGIEVDADAAIGLEEVEKFAVAARTGGPTSGRSRKRSRARSGPCGPCRLR